MAPKLLLDIWATFVANNFQKSPNLFALAVSENLLKTGCLPK